MVAGRNPKQPAFDVMPGSSESILRSYLENMTPGGIQTEKKLGSKYLPIPLIPLNLLPLMVE